MDESWRNRKTLILSRTDIMGLVTPAEYAAGVEQAYRMHGEGRFYMDPKGLTITGGASFTGALGNRTPRWR